MNGIYLYFVNKQLSGRYWDFEKQRLFGKGVKESDSPPPPFFFLLWEGGGVNYLTQIGQIPKTDNTIMFLFNSRVISPSPASAVAGVQESRVAGSNTPLGRLLFVE